MALIEIFRSPCRRRYYSTIFSKAFFVHYGFLIFSILISLIIAYTTRGFYKYNNISVEDPLVNILKNNLYCIIRSDKGVIYYGLPSVNNDAYQGYYRIPSISTQQLDSNSDSLPDVHYINLEFPMYENEKVYSCQIFIGFDFQLRRLARLKLEDFAYFEYSGNSDIANINVIADLVFKQKYPLNYKNYIFQQLPIITPTNIDNVLGSFYNNTASLRLSNQFVKWKTGRVNITPFKIKFLININPATVIYKPGFWYTAKWAWIQFSSIAIFSFYLQQLIKEYLFFHNYIPATVFSDLKCKCKLDK